MCVDPLRTVVQVAIVVRDLNKAVEYWSKILGLKPSAIVETENYEKTKMMFRGSPSQGRAKLAFFNLNNIVLELIEPIGGPSTWSEFLEKHGDGLHHIAFNFSENPECVDKIIKEIDGEIQQRGFSKGGKYIYVDARKSLGAIIEFLIRFKEVKKEE
jgi:catechol 2,3-dioxygenase-like lactoylglutathione lyase family enzyme